MDASDHVDLSTAGAWIVLMPNGAGCGSDLAEEVSELRALGVERVAVDLRGVRSPDELTPAEGSRLARLQLDALDERWQFALLTCAGRAERALAEFGTDALFEFIDERGRCVS